MSTTNETTRSVEEERKRSLVAKMCRERAEGYGAFRRSSLTAIALDRAADLLDAPSDAGFTTSSGGEGVEVTKADRTARIWCCDEALARLLPVALKEIDYDAIDRAFARHRLAATTPSPDASPDSGEETLQGRDKIALGKLHLLQHDPFPNAVTPVAGTSIIDWAVSEIHALRAASPASLSGGAEERARFEVWAKQGGHPLRQTYEEYDDKLTHVAWCAWKAATVPSPEAPANRQEAGKVEVAFEVWQGDELAAASSDEKDGWHYLTVYQQDGPATLVRAETRRTTLTSPKDVKGGEA